MYPTVLVAIHVSYRNKQIKLEQEFVSYQLYPECWRVDQRQAEPFCQGSFLNTAMHGGLLKLPGQNGSVPTSHVSIVKVIT